MERGEASEPVDFDRPGPSTPTKGTIHHGIGADTAGHGSPHNSGSPKSASSQGGLGTGLLDS